MGRVRVLDEIDAQLIIVAKHRADALSDLVDAFFRIVAADNRTEVLLKRRSRVARGLDPMGDDWWDKPPAAPPMIHR